jgi:hypothetical protein
VAADDELGGAAADLHVEPLGFGLFELHVGPQRLQGARYGLAVGARLVSQQDPGLHPVPCLVLMTRRLPLVGDGGIPGKGDLFLADLG